MDGSRYDIWKKMNNGLDEVVGVCGRNREKRSSEEGYEKKDDSRNGNDEKIG